MPKPRPLPLILLSLLALVAGCHSNPATGRRTHEDVPGSFADSSARSSYVDARVKELTDKGVSKDEAANRAAGEWFARAPVASETPTRQELKRRAAQADFEADLARLKEESKH